MIMDRIALTLAIIGGINWGSIGLFRFDIVAWLFGGQTATVSRVIYTLVGLLKEKVVPAWQTLLSYGFRESRILQILHRWNTGKNFLSDMSHLQGILVIRMRF